MYFKTLDDANNVSLPGNIAFIVSSWFMHGVSTIKDFTCISFKFHCNKANIYALLNRQIHVNNQCPKPYRKMTVWALCIFLGCCYIKIFLVIPNAAHQTCNAIKLWLLRCLVINPTELLRFIRKIDMANCTI